MLPIHRSRLSRIEPLPRARTRFWQHPRQACQLAPRASTHAIRSTNVALLCSHYVRLTRTTQDLIVEARRHSHTPCRDWNCATLSTFLPLILGFDGPRNESLRPKESPGSTACNRWLLTLQDHARSAIVMVAESPSPMCDIGDEIV